MLVPLPTAIVDLLLSLSLAGAVLLLVISVGVRRSVEFIDFPTLLLMTTLYRLALNIQTTRLILGHGDAGQVIDAFATLVVQGELIVGFTMFAIITAVQYLVIARGSERVAEVAARFALDALPGHQGAIDADLRSGAVTPRQAAERRERLGEQSNFYGAMDGAVRFVKGDAIVGLFIIFVNILGGLAMGLSRGEGSVLDSRDVYGRLAIGDGLLAQLPALFISLSAGVLVARVDRNHHASEQASEQAQRQSLPEWLDPAMLVVPAVLLFGLALVPGMPGVAFGLTAGGLVVSALWINLRRAEGPEATTRPAFVCIRVSAQLAAAIEGQSRVVEALRERCAMTLAIEMPEFATVVESRAPANFLRVTYGRRVLADTTVASQDVGTLVVAVYRAVMSHAACFVDLQTLDRMLEQARATTPTPVREALARMTVVDLLELIRGFLRERVAAPPLPILLEVVSTDRRFSEDSERSRWGEIARLATAAIWVHEIISRPQQVRWLRPSPIALEELSESVVRGIGGMRLTLSPQAITRWHEHLTACRGDTQAPAVIVTTPRGRPIVARLTKGLHPHLPVISTAELRAAGMTVTNAVAEFGEPDSTHDDTFR